jgi:pimeloyl-ACP methyl ester carboxylesterase
MPFFRRGDVVIHYEQHGSGFPLLLLPPGGMNATIDSWSGSFINPIQIFKDEFRVVVLDQRNAGESSGPIDTEDPWSSYASDQLGLMNHLGIERFHAMGCCIGSSYALNLARLAPERVVSAVLEQPVGIDQANRQVLPNVWKPWAKAVLEMRTDLNREMLEVIGRKMWAGEFVLSVTRDFVRSCQTPLLVLPGNNQAHPTAIGREIAELAPNAELIEPWHEPSDLLPSTVARIRSFLRANTPS